MTDGRRRRPKTAARGYGSAHQRMRRALMEVATMETPCARCGRPLGADLPAGRVDLGHVDGSRSRYRGLEHQACNRATRRRGQLPPAAPEAPAWQPPTPALAPGEAPWLPGEFGEQRQDIAGRWWAFHTAGWSRIGRRW